MNGLECMGSEPKQAPMGKKNRTRAKNVNFI